MQHPPRPAFPVVGAEVCLDADGRAGRLLGVNRAVGTQARNLIPAGGPVYPHDLGQWPANPPGDPAGRVAAAWHVNGPSLIGEHHGTPMSYGTGLRYHLRSLNG
ncbi:hypothetical protein ACFYP4_04000 [Streptomyces sp. NPDC005551]|uniref:hypothetical protein n=1 Tax=unclassified Streptomyces TaxID=2593676 RepID=UPI0033D5957B